MTEIVPLDILQNNQTDTEKLRFALVSLSNSILIIYSQFQLYFHIFFLLLIAYVFYILGKSSVKEPVVSKIQKLTGTIERTQTQKSTIPKMIQQLKFKIKMDIFLIILIGAMGAGLIWLQYIVIDYLYFGATVGIFVIYLIYLVIQKQILLNRKKRFLDEEKRIRQNVKDLAQSLGPKVQQSLKTSLCRQKISSKKSQTTLQCHKSVCKQHRAALKTRFQLIRNLIDTALNFEWCSICKKRDILDELIGFEPKPMPEGGQDKSDNQVELRIKYLMNSFEGILNWINEAGPCNCSKLYIGQIITNKKNYSHFSKPVFQKIKQLESLEKRQLEINQKQKKTIQNNKQIEKKEKIKKKSD